MLQSESVSVGIDLSLKIEGLPEDDCPPNICLHHRETMLVSKNTPKLVI